MLLDFKIHATSWFNKGISSFFNYPCQYWKKSQGIISLCVVSQTSLAQVKFLLADATLLPLLLLIKSQFLRIILWKIIKYKTLSSIICGSCGYYFRASCLQYSYKNIFNRSLLMDTIPVTLNGSLKIIKISSRLNKMLHLGKYDHFQH